MNNIGRRKKLLLLGGLRYLLPVIKVAHNLGYYVITCDYLPSNIAHQYADEYHNVSIIDKEAVLTLAKELQIDGIMSFAVDPGVMTAAYVQEQLGLPACGPYESVCILQNKDKFRAFLSEHSFSVPWAFGFSSIEDALLKSDVFTYPLIVKPTDSAGSKGVTRVDFSTELEYALHEAFLHSMSRRVIVEEFIEKEGCSSDSDCFSVDGELKFVSFSAQHFDDQAANPYTPSAYSWPSTFTETQEKELTSEIQRLLKLLGMRTSIYNVETRIGKNGKIYIMEVSPRGGGNRLAEMLQYAMGVDLISNTVRAAMGDEVVNVEQRPCNVYWVEVILHADKEGIFVGLEISREVACYVVETDLWIQKGDRVSVFNGANDTIGTMIVRFFSVDQLNERITSVNQWVRINVN